MLYSMDLPRTQARETAFQIALRDCSKEVREKPGYRSFCNKNQVVGTSNNYCWLKKIRHPKLRNLPVFCVQEDARVWAH